MSKAYDITSNLENIKAWQKEQLSITWICQKLGIARDTFKKHFPEYYPAIRRKTATINGKYNYDLNPKLCLECKNKIEYRYRINQFCGRSCSASYNNHTRAPIIVTEKMREKVRANHAKGIYKKALKERIFKSKSLYERVMSRTFEESSLDYKRLRVIFEQNSTCNKCGLKEWNNIPIAFEVDHIDGNNTNNIRENLVALCPNCHAQTPTYCGRNKRRRKFPTNIIFYEKYKQLGTIRQTLLAFNLAAKGGNYAAAKRIIYKFEPRLDIITITPTGMYCPYTKVNRGDEMVPTVGLEPTT